MTSNDVILTFFLGLYIAVAVVAFIQGQVQAASSRYSRVQHRKAKGRH